MKQMILSTLIFLFLCTQGCKTIDQQSVYDSIPAIFSEIEALTKKNVSLWNKNLYGPILLIDPESMKIYANEPDTAGILKPDGKIYSGILPDNVNFGNTAMKWGGKVWATLMLPLPENKYERNDLFAHESFHRVQPSLGFISNVGNNDHLDDKNARIYLRLELEALKNAIQASSKKEIKQHLTNAMTFRKYRNLLYPESNKTENSLELKEGLAEFTGLIISGRNKELTTKHLVSRIIQSFENPTFVRSFAYYTTPVYGYLLYNENKKWNKDISDTTNLTEYFIKAFNINIPADLKNAFEIISDNYNGKTIVQEETAKEEENKRKIAEYKHIFIELPHFELMFIKMNIQFDPRTLMPLEDMGTFFPHIRVTDEWGILTVENGALIDADWVKISITNPVKTEDKIIIGNGWTLELTEGYVIEKEKTSGNYKLTKR